MAPLLDFPAFDIPTTAARGHNRATSNPQFLSAAMYSNQMNNGGFLAPPTGLSVRQTHSRNRSADFPTLSPMPASPQRSPQRSPKVFAIPEFGSPSRSPSANRTPRLSMSGGSNLRESALFPGSNYETDHAIALAEALLAETRQRRTYDFFDPTE